MNAGYAYLWEFHVRAESRDEFERHYGPEGSWAALFRRAPGYLGTHLLRDRATDGRYLTIDRWQSEAAYRAFHAQFSREYAELDRSCEGLTLSECALGTYST